MLVMMLRTVALAAICRSCSSRTEIFERVNLVDGVLAHGCGLGKWIFPPIELRLKSLPGV